ncbi:MAG: hypothetical protein DLM69_00360 [Candidatus Chloroheliales bacterium]|nr:MAG: hypothetical protein DLM69_00360 [Chloroflexota bacterium]
MVSVTRTYKYRLYPTKDQVERLEWVLRQCRSLYNACLEQRITAYKRCGVNISKNQQSRELTELKGELPEYNQIGDHVLRDMLHRLGEVPQP